MDSELALGSFRLDALGHPSISYLGRLAGMGVIVAKEVGAASRWPACFELDKMTRYSHHQVMKVKISALKARLSAYIAAVRGGDDHRL